MKSYGQYCGVARALDAIGDRWALLLIRELAIRDCRYTDLQRGLPGIATNLLSNRLRALETSGLLEKTEDNSTSIPMYSLTPRGRELDSVLRELARWAMPLMAVGQQGDEAQGHWLTLAVEAIYKGARLTDDATVEVETEGETFVFEASEDGIRSWLGSADSADLRLAGPAEAVIETLVNPKADRSTVTISGDLGIIDRLRAQAFV